MRVLLRTLGLSDLDGLRVNFFKNSRRCGTHDEVRTSLVGERKATVVAGGKVLHDHALANPFTFGHELQSVWSASAQKGLSHMLLPLPVPLWRPRLALIDFAKNVPSWGLRVIPHRLYDLLQFCFEREALVLWPSRIERHPRYFNGDFLTVKHREEIWWPFAQVADIAEIHHVGSSL